MSILQERNFNTDIAAAVGDLVRGRSNAAAGNIGNPNNGFEQNLAAQIAPVVLASVRTLTQQQAGQQGSGQGQQSAGYQQLGDQGQGGYQQSGQQLGHQAQPGQQGYQSQPGYQQQQGIQAQQGYQSQQHGYQSQPGFGPQPGYQPQHNGSGQPQRLSSRGTLAAVITPIVAEALVNYQSGQNAVRRFNGSQPFDKQWHESITSIVADVAPAVVDALKNFAPQPGSQQSLNTSNLQAAAQRGSFDDLNSVVAASVPVVINALRDYQPPALAAGQRGWSDDVVDVARIAAPIAIAAL